MFIDAIHRRATHEPDGLAVVTQKRRVTNAALWAEVSSLAAWLMRAGFGPGDIVGISIRDEYRNLLTALAAMRAGVSQITLPTHDPPEARNAVARRLKIAAVLTDEPHHAFAGLPAIAPDFTFRATSAQPAIEPPSADVDCLYLSSSGTTGRAKIIPLSQRQLLLQAMTVQSPPRRDVLYRPASIEFNNSKRHRLYCLATGGTNLLIHSPGFSISEVCRSFGVTLLALSVVQARWLLDMQGADARLPEHTELQLRGSPVSGELRQNILRRITPRLVVGYGTSEFGSIASAMPEDHRRHPATVGRVHRGIELEIVDDGGRPVARNSSGHIRVRGAGMATRYHDDDEMTATTFRDGWFYPGDVGHFGEAGDLRFDGRADDMMVLSSINIFPAEIECVAAALPSVVECAAFSIKSGEFGDIPLLAVVADGSTSAEAVLVSMRRALGLRAPRKVFMVDKLPRGAEGKVLRTELRELAEAPARRAVA